MTKKTFTIAEIVKKKKVQAADGPHANKLQPGLTHPENWTSQLHSGMGQYELKKLAEELHSAVARWQDDALEAKHAFDKLSMNGGRNFEMFSPLILKGLSKEKLQMICDICMHLMHQAPII